MRHGRSPLARIAAGSAGGAALHALRGLFRAGLLTFCAGHTLCKLRRGAQDHLGQRSQAGGQEAGDDHKSTNPASSRSHNRHSARSGAQEYPASTSGEPGVAGNEGADPCDAYPCSSLCRRIGRWAPPAHSPSFVPELLGDGEGIDAKVGPPGRLVSGAMQRPVMRAAKWDRELVTDLAAEGSRLCKANVVRIRGRSSADQARLRADEAKVPLVTPSRSFWDRELDLRALRPIGECLTVARRGDI